jgi:hypothetical protein
MALHAAQTWGWPLLVFALVAAAAVSYALGLAHTAWAAGLALMKGSHVPPHRRVVASVDANRLSAPPADAGPDTRVSGNGAVVSASLGTIGLTSMSLSAAPLGPPGLLGAEHDAGEELHPAEPRIAQKVQTKTKNSAKQYLTFFAPTLDQSAGRADAFTQGAQQPIPASLL